MLDSDTSVVNGEGTDDGADVAVENREILGSEKLTEQLLSDYFTDLLQTGAGVETPEKLIKEDLVTEAADASFTISSAPVVRVRSAESDGFSAENDEIIPPFLVEDPADSLVFDPSLWEGDQLDLNSSPKLLGDLNFLRAAEPTPLSECELNDSANEKSKTSWLSASKAEPNPKVVSHLKTGFHSTSADTMLVDPKQADSSVEVKEALFTSRNNETSFADVETPTADTMGTKKLAAKNPVTLSPEYTTPVSASLVSATGAPVNKALVAKKQTAQKRVNPKCDNASSLNARPRPSGWLESVKASDQGFETLLFTVQGLTMGVPLARLGQIYFMPKLSPLPGQPRWMLGVSQAGQSASTLKVVNTALWVMPERYSCDSFENNAKYIIGLHGSDWCLAVDEIKQPVTLLPKDVVWKRAGSKRPWLAGTIKAHMCALLDVEVSVQKLSVDAKIT